MWALALLAATATAATRTGDKLEGEYGQLCSECVLTGHHAQSMARDLVRDGEFWTVERWRAAIDAACLRRHPDEQPMCEVFARQHGGAVASEMVDLVADAEGPEDASIATPDAVAAGLCAFDGLTASCPKNAHAFRAKAVGAKSETQVAVRNTRKVGAIEVHAIDKTTVGHCAPSEETDSSFYIVKPGEEALVVLTKSMPRPGDAADHAETYLRVKPRHAPCGDGTDYYVDRSQRFWAVDVLPNRRFDEAAPRSGANKPLLVQPAASRAPVEALPAGLPPKKKRKRRREL